MGSCTSPRSAPGFKSMKKGPRSTRRRRRRTTIPRQTVVVGDRADHDGDGDGDGGDDDDC